MNETRVVITGMGAITALGHSFPETWSKLLAGHSGLGPITLFDTTGFNVHVACEVKDFQPERWLDAKEARRRDRYQQLAAVATQEALTESGLTADYVQPERVGIIISAAIGGVSALEEAIPLVKAGQQRRMSPFAIPMLMSNGAAGLTGIDYGFQGPSFSVSSACASGADGIGIASMLIRAGVIDAAIAGASEAAITPVGVAAFDRVGAMSRKDGIHQLTPQPFDLDRDGLVIGEGAAILVLESEQHARQRGAAILAELAGYAATADAYHITAPEENGAGGAKAIHLALKSAQVNPDQVDYINAHGTGTKLNDLSETRAIKAAFGEWAYQIPVSSTKSMTGHLMGATGALEAIFCVQAIRDGILPPTINYRTPDPLLDLDYVPNQARPARIQTAISNSFGFGGHNAVLVLKEYV